MLEAKVFVSISAETDLPQFSGSLLRLLRTGLEMVYSRWLEACVQLNLRSSTVFPLPLAHLDRAVLHASRLASHVAGVAAACAAFHLHAGRPDDEVGRGGIHLAPGDLVDGRPHLTHGRQRLFHHCGDRDGRKHVRCVAFQAFQVLPWEPHLCSSCAGCVPDPSLGQGSYERRPCSAGV